MAYEKPIELQVSTQNISGTEARSVEALTKIERLLNKTLSAGEIFKSPAASIDYKTHEVTKSFFVRKDAEKIVRDTLKAHEELFINPLTIASKEATTRRYKVDVEGDRALASLRANTASLGGRVYGNQHGTYIEVPSYKGSLASAKSDAVNITQTMRAKQEEAREKEAIKVQKEKEREEIRKQKEAEKEEKQKEREKEKEERKAATESKHRGLAIVAGISSTILLLRKLISLVENIVTGILKASGEAFTTTMEADRLGIDPVILRNLKYAGLAKGIGEAPKNALQATNSLFGTQLLAAENVDKLTQLAPMLGGDVVDLINKGDGGKSPFKMTATIIDSAFNNYINGLNELNQATGNDAANKRSIANTLEQASEDYATIFTRMVQDYEAGKKVEGFQQWIYDAMPISSPSSANLAAATENKKEFDKAVAELKSVINLIETTLSPLLNPLTEAIQKLSGVLMRMLGDKGGVRGVSRDNYDEMLKAKARDEAEVKNLTAIENEYLANNKDLFPDEKSFNYALNELQRSGKVPSAIANDPDRSQEFFNALGVRVLMDLYKQNLRSYADKEEDFSKNSEKYASGEKTFSFSDKSPAELLSLAEKLIEQEITKAYKQGKGIAPPRMVSQQENWLQAAKKAQAKKKREEEVKQQYLEYIRETYLPHLEEGDAYIAFYDRNSVPKAVRDKKLDELYAAYDADVEARAAPMVPVTSGTGFGWDDAFASENAVTTTLNMLAGNLIVQALKADGKIQDGTKYIEISKREDSNLNIRFFNADDKEIQDGIIFSDEEKHGVTKNITLYLAE